MSENSINRLARLAECSDPDSETSPGGTFLRRVESDVEEAREYGRLSEDRSDLAHEIADSAVPTYTHERWQVFTDLAAWQQDVADLTSGDEDMTTLAGYALYEAARTLVWRLLEDATEQDR